MVICSEDIKIKAAGLAPAGPVIDRYWKESVILHNLFITRKSLIGIGFTFAYALGLEKEAQSLELCEGDLCVPRFLTYIVWQS